MSGVSLPPVFSGTLAHSPSRACMPSGCHRLLTLYPALRPGLLCPYLLPCASASMTSWSSWTGPLAARARHGEGPGAGGSSRLCPGGAARGECALGLTAASEARPQLQPGDPPPGPGAATARRTAAAAPGVPLPRDDSVRQARMGLLPQHHVLADAPTPTRTLPRWGWGDALGEYKGLLSHLALVCAAQDAVHDLLPALNCLAAFHAMAPGPLARSAMALAALGRERLFGRSREESVARSAWVGPLYASLHLGTSSPATGPSRQEGQRREREVREARESQDPCAALWAGQRMRWRVCWGPAAPMPRGRGGSWASALQSGTPSCSQRRMDADSRVRECGLRIADVVGHAPPWSTHSCHILRISCMGLSLPGSSFLASPSKTDFLARQRQRARALANSGVSSQPLGVTSHSPRLPGLCVVLPRGPWCVVLPRGPWCQGWWRSTMLVSWSVETVCPLRGGLPAAGFLAGALRGARAVRRVLVPGAGHGHTAAQRHGPGGRPPPAQGHAGGGGTGEPGREPGTEGGGGALARSGQGRTSSADMPLLLTYQMLCKATVRMLLALSPGPQDAPGEAQVQQRGGVLRAAL